MLVRTVVPVDRLMSAQGEALTALWSALRQSDIDPAGAPYVRYHTFGDDTDMEVGVPVTAPPASPTIGGVTAGTLPGGRSLVATHEGSHDRLNEAYGALQGAVRRDDLTEVGAAWEEYQWIDLRRQPDPASWPAPDVWVTEVVLPIR
ncbi:hypothetical protein GCM10029963_76970 [Micromonospora andamanensis]|uniref:GyrI-like small molecule binding domain-containing protein n=2 Tax=Micromonospora andamanensis TaxID=1287068 RepID=A0ABQ4I2E5_9ACTN|nr:hypothetical protein Van01_52910 [Micromonospora andamanensis]GIJ42939.1 hypothetical protein Vwe01_62640 [Micromonospora andamanensis]